ncbi:unnamed protein product [Caenorhabditis bovis]|uniref:Peroxin-5 n=1 Tax=Caenorhabditis bovis TaxID=2654633 RepID=A0A8S1EWN8_9PELO|nr:unnamed protein product [Caenorhabditis bovis]
MKSVVEGQCGQQNALVGLATSIGTSNQRIAPSSAAASTFMPNSTIGERMADEFMRMRAQANAPTSFNMNSLQQNLPQASASSALAKEWSNDFQPRQNQLASQWANQYSANHLMNYDSAWRQAMPASSSSVQAPVSSSMWSAEFLDNAESSLQQGSSKGDQWADEFLNHSQDTFKGTHNEMYEPFWDEFQKKIDSLDKKEDYVYQEANPFVSSQNPLAEGDALMRQGDIGNAMLSYEAAVQKNPQDANAWCLLGLAHAENEKDQQALAAFNKCLEIDPTNQQALLSLAVSLANEGMENEAVHRLDKWLSSYIGSNATEVSSPNIGPSSFLDHDAFNLVEARFLNAARQQTTPDPELQNALGVLYNLNRNFDRAVDSLKLAISQRPDDARLWNRLGATLANGDRTAEAVSAYREALKRYPTYVRARYNLGISCMQLSTHREAMNHFISALELQKGGVQNSGIWSTLRSAAIRTKNIPDSVLNAIEERNLDAVKANLQNV